MKKHLVAIAGVCAAMVFSSCENLNEDFGIAGAEEITIHASVAEQPVDTKSAIYEFGSEKVTFKWLAGDAISVFFGDSEGSIFVTDVTASKAKFKGTIGAVMGGGDDLTDETSLWGVYPYDKNTTCDGSSITMTLPHEQDAAAETFADDLFPSLARSTNFTMAFYPVCGSIRFKVSDPEIVKVTLSGNNDEDLAGTATVSMPLGGAPVVDVVSEGQKELVMKAPDGGCFDTSKYYYFVMYPTDFTKGLTITYYKEDEKASYVLNSSVKVRRNRFTSATNKDAGLNFTGTQGGEIGGDDEVIKVQTIYMLSEAAILAPGTSYSLDTDYEPYNATNTVWSWKSSDASVAYVDGNGKVTAFSDGEATITATATDGSGATASCLITVKAVTAVADVEYKDEYGVNHGRGIAIGDVVWAPVNCGYHATDYPYGKLYQWGRKYGQGYSIEYDSTVPEIIEGPVKVTFANDSSNSNVFYVSNGTYKYDWALYKSDELWNLGTESSPIKNKDNDPCPDGWRVPTFNELNNLCDNYSLWTPNSSKQNGFYFSGEYAYLEYAPRIFFPAAGYLTGSKGSHSLRCERGYYWSSKPQQQAAAYFLYFYDTGVRMNYDELFNGRAAGYSVRCVQE